ncbi:MAG TPA: universal stress protein [Caulobacteraceae bacterium]|jgi:nucleotide-binding universal stress UspA family protein|nr:universal stress protein [Caulobacteraceae bacterium]
MNPEAPLCRYGTILVHVDADIETSSRLKAAFCLGARFGARVIGLGAVAWDSDADFVAPVLAGETLERLRQDVDDDLAVAEAAFRTAAKGYAFPTIWRTDTDYPKSAMARQSCAADLIVASPGRGLHDRRRFPSTVDLVMESGVPVIVVPPGEEPLQPRTVVVGWKNTRETRRAVSDALPLLQIAERVHIVQICDDRDHGAALCEMDDVVRRLARHGVVAEPATWPPLALGPSVAEDLMCWAQSHVADTMVVGAYGHSRAKQWVFGGVTTELLANVPRRILFSR